MAVPTIQSVTPSTGQAWGRDLVRIVGDNFGVGVVVEFGGASAEVVNLVGGDDGFIDVRTPACPVKEPGAVAVSVQNLDEDGDEVDGELATSAGAYTFVRAETTLESNLARLARSLLKLIKQQVLASTGMDVAVDFDADADDDVRVVQVAEVPSLTLAGPRAVTNRALQRRERRLVAVQGTGGLEFVRLAPAKTVDLVFTLMATTRSKVQLLNLIESIGAWLNVNPRIYMLADEDDPTSQRRWPMDHGDFRSSLKGADDLRTATVEITIRGFNLHEGRPLDRSRLVAETIVGTEPLE